MLSNNFYNMFQYNGGFNNIKYGLKNIVLTGLLIVSFLFSMEFIYIFLFMLYFSNLLLLLISLLSFKIIIVFIIYKRLNS